jgi:hypothetical protein
MIPHSRKVADSTRRLDLLEAQIRQLKIEFDKFFNGAVKIPPEELRTKVQRRFQKIRTHPMRTFADRFRLSTLETRFNVLNELFNRRLRETELAARKKALPPKADKRLLDALEGIDLGSADDGEAVAALHEALYRFAASGAHPDLESFRDLLQTKIETLRQETECELVQFRVAAAGNQLQLRAKPVPHGDHHERAAT